MKNFIVNYVKLHHVIIIITIICFVSISFTTTAADSDYISINCGGAAAASGLGGRQWLRDTAPKRLSTASTVKGELLIAVDPVPYKTARLSLYQFSYSFDLNPGQKFLRIHFNPASYSGFQNYNDFFSVEAGPYTLLANFSASITARALGVNTVAKEFCIIIQEQQHLDIVFAPESTSQSKHHNYAFVNGIEIISVPSTVSYCDGGESGIRVLGQKYAIHLDNSTALEMVHRQNIKWGSDDGIFGMWPSSSSSEKKTSNRIWRVPVDVGFRYFVRAHLCELGLKINNDFKLVIDDVVALDSPDMLHKEGNLLWYNYLVTVEGHKREGKRNISILLHSQHEFLNRHGPFEGFEVFKLSNHDRSLASPNLPSPGPAVPTTLHSGLSKTYVVFTVLCLVGIGFNLLQSIHVPTNDHIEEDNKPSVRIERLICKHCRIFTLPEIHLATDNFHSSFIIGQGGFGTVYKGFIDNRREIVAFKRLKPDSRQGELQFWTEVEMLSQLRHVNLVSLIGCCFEQNEMIIVYEYMPNGTLADYLYKLARKSKDFRPLTWKQRLNICIGTSRALDYLHTGHAIIHRDVKASNILLDEMFVAKFSDFGLAKMGSFSESQTQDSTNLKGTLGYIDPNFFQTHKLTTDSDMYSFGVVLLEVLCGRPAVDPCNEDDKRILTWWAKENIENGQVDRIVAPSLRGEISPDSLQMFVKVAERCLHDDPKKRPAAAHVVIMLEKTLQLQEMAESLPPNDKMTSFKDVIFSSTENSQKDEKESVMVANEIRNVADALPHKGNGIIHVTADKSHHGRAMLLSGNVTQKLRPIWKLWPIWKTRKSLYKAKLVDISLCSAPYRARNIALPVNG